ncbi:MAG: ECF transporter S component [Oscillospiraceae bacterium]
MKRISIKRMVLSAMFLAIGLVLPFLTGQIPQIGSMLLPMHLPVLICGFVCGGWWGLAVGIICPVLRSVIFGMPPMFPTAAAMALELGVYGLITGILYNALPKNRLSVYVALIAAMAAGRIVWGLARLIFSFASTAAFTWQAFIAGAITTAIPGIVLQIVIVPVIIFIIERRKLVPIQK